MEQFNAELNQSTNPMVSVIYPAWQRGRSREFRTLAYLGLVRAALEYKLHGEAGLKTVSDPCGQGPFAFRRFIFEGVDRGFELKSAFAMDGNKAVLIFVEKEGPPFRVGGNFPGQALPASNK